MIEDIESVLGLAHGLAEDEKLITGKILGEIQDIEEMMEEFKTLPMETQIAYVKDACDLVLNTGKFKNLSQQ